MIQLQRSRCCSQNRITCQIGQYYAERKRPGVITHTEEGLFHHLFLLNKQACHIRIDTGRLCMKMLRFLPCHRESPHDEDGVWERPEQPLADILNESSLFVTVTRKVSAGSPDGFLVRVWKSDSFAHGGVWQSYCMASGPAESFVSLCWVWWGGGRCRWAVGRRGRGVGRGVLKGHCSLPSLWIGIPPSSPVLCHSPVVTSSPSLPHSSALSSFPVLSPRVSHLSRPQLSCCSVFSLSFCVSESSHHLMPTLP